MFILQNHHTAIMVIAVILFIAFAWTHGYFGGCKATMSKVSTMSPMMSPMMYTGSDIAKPTAYDTCGCHDLVNGAAVDCPQDKNFDKGACLKGSAPCACWT